MSESATTVGPGGESLAEIGRARDRFEALLWARCLTDQGIEVRSRRRGGWLGSLLWLWSQETVYVPSADAERARTILRQARWM